MIKAVALDIDGVLTDGTFWWDGSGMELKRFSFRDVMGIARASRAGIVFGLISGEQNPIVDRLAAKLNIRHVWQGCKEKEAAFRQFAEACGLPLEQIAFMGDDVNDVETLKIAGFSATPADGHESVAGIAKLVTKHSSGRGAVREMLDYLKLVP